ncbi:hypothetical protein [Kitasatospora acidiphila]
MARRHTVKDADMRTEPPAVGDDLHQVVAVRVVVPDLQLVEHVVGRQPG